MNPGDILIDGGNSYFKDDIRRSKLLAEKGLHYVDVGTSGGVWGLERGYCMMIGGPKEIVQKLDPIFKTLAPGRGDIPRTPGREKLSGTAEEGYIYCGPSGSGHFVKMVHNGIEYGIMQAYAEGFDIFRNASKSELPKDEQYDFNLPDIAEVWRRGSVVSSWLLDLTAMALAENPDFLVGVKVRMSENVIFKHGLEPLKRAIQACEMCGWPARMMVHIGGVETKEMMSQILDLLRPGDVLTHSYTGAPNIAGAFTNIVQDGKLLPAALSAKQRGVMFDVGHGGGSFDFTVAEVAIPGGCTPDTISSDIHVFSGNSPGMPYLPNVMSKFILLGYTVEQVVAMATTAPAKIINRAPKIGTLQIGAPGDVAIMELVEGQISFVDTRNNKREGKLLLKPVQTVINGVPFGRPYQAPFAVR